MDPSRELKDIVTLLCLQLDLNELLPMHVKAEFLTAINRISHPFLSQPLHSDIYLCNVAIIFMQNPCQQPRNKKFKA